MYIQEEIESAIRESYSIGGYYIYRTDEEKDSVSEIIKNVVDKEDVLYVPICFRTDRDYVDLLKTTLECIMNGISELNNEAEYDYIADEIKAALQGNDRDELQEQIEYSVSDLKESGIYMVFVFYDFQNATEYSDIKSEDLSVWRAIASNVQARIIVTGERISETENKIRGKDVYSESPFWNIFTMDFGR